jgi:hypothetical protein
LAQDDFSNLLAFGKSTTLPITAADLGNPACTGPSDPDSLLRQAPGYTDGMFNSVTVMYTCATLDQINNFNINAQVFSARPAVPRGLWCPPGYSFSVTEVIPRSLDFCLGYYDNPPPAGDRLGPGALNNRGYRDLWDWLDNVALNGPYAADWSQTPDGTGQLDAKMYCTNKPLLSKKLLNKSNIESFTVYDLFSATKAARDALYRSAPVRAHLDPVTGAGKDFTPEGRTGRYTTGTSDPGWTDTLFRQACYGYRNGLLKTGADLSVTDLAALRTWPESDTMCDSSTIGPASSTTMPDLLNQYVKLVENGAGNYPTLVPDFNANSLISPLDDKNPVWALVQPSQTWKQLRCLSKTTCLLSNGECSLQHSTCDRYGCVSDCCEWLADSPDYLCCADLMWKAPVLRVHAFDDDNNNCNTDDCPSCTGTFGKQLTETRYQGGSDNYPNPDGSLTANCHRFRCATSATYTPGSTVLAHHKSMMLAETAKATKPEPFAGPTLKDTDATCIAGIQRICTGRTTCDSSTFPTITVPGILGGSTQVNYCTMYNVDYACIPPRSATSVGDNKYVAFGFSSTSAAAQPFPAALSCPAGGPITVTEAGSSHDRLTKSTNTTAAVATLCTGKPSCSVPLAAPYAAARDSTLMVRFSCACPASRTQGFKAAQTRVVSAGVASCVATKCDAGTFRTTAMSDCAPSAAGRAVGSAGATSDGPQCAPGSYSDLPGNTVCQRCPPGTFQANSGGLSCDPCPANTFQNVSGSSVCALCSLNSFSNVAAQQCEPMAAGLYRSGAVGQWGSGNYGVVAPCSPGTSSNRAGDPCAPCATGTYASGFGSVFCSACPLGTYSLGAVGQALPVSCTPCPDGKVTLRLSSTSAENCSAPDALDWQRVAQTVTDCSALLVFGRPGMEDATLKAATLKRLQRQLGNGFCQGGPFNTAPCGWDGGDCCLTTCRVPQPLNETLLAEDQTDPSLLKGACSQQQLICLDPGHSQASARSARAGRDDARAWLGQGVCGAKSQAPTSPTEAPSTASPTTAYPTTVAPSQFPTREGTDYPTTVAPSLYPSRKPTTSAPTTKQPTTAPPTSKPIVPHTPYPTPTTPNKKPTALPTVMTKTPTTTSPTFSKRPTGNPSAAPTGVPSLAPTSAPWLAGLGDGHCDAVYNSTAYAFDNGDCDPRRGDGYCNMDLNTALLGWDGGDCCWHTCRATRGHAGSCLLTDPSLCLDLNATDLTTPILKLYGKPVVCSNLACVDWPLVTARDDDPCFSGAIEVKDVYSDCDGATKNCSTYMRSWRTWDAAGHEASLNYTARVNMAPPTPTRAPTPGAAPAAGSTALTIGLAAAGAVLVLAAVATAVMLHKKRGAQQTAGSVGVELGNTITAADPV